MGKRVIALLVVVAIAVGITGFAIVFFNHWKHTAVGPSSNVVFVVKPGESYQKIAESLEEKGLVKNRRLFQLLGWFEGKLSSIQAGEYFFDQSVDPVSLLGILTSGEVVKYQVRLPEGGTFSQFKKILRSEEKLDFDLEDTTNDNVLKVIGVANEVSAVGSEYGEGWFFPDTYVYSAGERASNVLKQAFERMSEVLNDSWKSASASEVITSPYDLLILASIVEKESSIRADRLKVSGVFVRRLEKGMKLQADPTVIYGLGESYDGDLKRKHLREDTEYNTYTRDGLPPTPICSPSADCLNAAANPAPGEEIFFVGRGDGTTQFSKTLREHNEAVRHYQLRTND